MEFNCSKQQPCSYSPSNKTPDAIKYPISIAIAQCTVQILFMALSIVTLPIQTNKSICYVLQNWQNAIKISPKNTRISFTKIPTRKQINKIQLNVQLKRITKKCNLFANRGAKSEAKEFNSNNRHFCH